ncbi:MAG: VOC family protein [Alphaproteobacteria bacterium]|nr:VOC family protein [Alphaproteobacteria bacterium]
MDIMGLFAAVYVTDLDRSLAWYAKIVGRDADHRPMPTLAQWVGVAGAGLQLFLDPAKAGRGRMTLVTPDVDKAKAELARNGVAAGETFRGDFGAIAEVEDPDGNLVTLAEPPKPR